MMFFRFLFYIIFFQSFYTFGHSQQDKFQKSLVLTKHKGVFTVTVPYEYWSETQTAYYRAPKVGKTFHFCQSTINWNGKEFNYLAKNAQIEPNAEFDDSYKCDYIAEETFVKAYNPKKLKNVPWNYDEMELYHSGYVVKTDRNLLAKAREIFTVIGKPQPEYLVPNLNFEFITMIEFYNNMKTKQIVAAEYILLSTNIPYYETVFNIENILREHEYEKGDLSIFQCINSPDYTECFENILSDDCLTELIDTAKINKLTTIMFAPAQHFSIPIWRNPSRTYLNFFPMWTKPKLAWDKVDTIARTVAKHLGDLKVTVGITGEMTLCGNVVQDKYEYKLPKYYWKVFEYSTEENNYGIIVVLNYNSFIKTEETMCAKTTSCQTNGWMIDTNDYETGEIYCCAVTKENIKTLDKYYLRFQQSKVFNLNQWDKLIKVVEKEYYGWSDED